MSFLNFKASNHTQSWKTHKSPYMKHLIQLLCDTDFGHFTVVASASAASARHTHTTLSFLLISIRNEDGNYMPSQAYSVIPSEFILVLNLVTVQGEQSALQYVPTRIK